MVNVTGLTESADVLLKYCSNVRNEAEGRQKQVAKLTSAIETKRAAMRKRHSDTAQKVSDVATMSAERADLRKRLQDLKICCNAYRSLTSDAAGKKTDELRGQLSALQQTHSTGAAQLADTHGMEQQWRLLEQLEQEANEKFLAAIKQRITLHRTHFSELFAKQLTPTCFKHVEEAAQFNSQRVLYRVDATRLQWREACMKTDQLHLEAERLRKTAHEAAAAVAGLQAEKAECERQGCAQGQHLVEARAEVARAATTREAAQREAAAAEQRAGEAREKQQQRAARAAGRVAMLEAEVKAAETEAAALEGDGARVEHERQVAELREYQEKTTRQLLVVAAQRAMVHRLREVKAELEKPCIEKEHQAAVLQSECEQKEAAGKASQLRDAQRMHELQLKLLQVLTEKLTVNEDSERMLLVSSEQTAFCSLCEQQGSAAKALNPPRVHVDDTQQHAGRPPSRDRRSRSNDAPPKKRHLSLEKGGATKRVPLKKGLQDFFTEGYYAPPPQASASSAVPRGSRREQDATSDASSLFNELGPYPRVRSRPRTSESQKKGKRPHDKRGPAPSSASTMQDAFFSDF